MRAFVWAVILAAGSLGTLDDARTARAQTDPAALRLLELDNVHGLGRYQVTVRAGSTLWDIAATCLPLERLDHGDTAAYDLVVDSFRRAAPDRTPASIQPDESFTLEVPLETFVTESLTSDGPLTIYRSFQGDRLSISSRPTGVGWRLVRQADPAHALVGLNPVGRSPSELAVEAYQVERPDFIQVREVKAALGERSPRLTVDLTRPYRDDFRNYRDRAVQVDDQDGLKVYTFAQDDVDNPFVRVEDAIGDMDNPNEFPRDVRLAYYRDGTVKTYLLTEPGDTLGPLARPDTETWNRVLPKVLEWHPGEVEQFAAFSQAVTPNGQVLPGRLLALTFRPRVMAPSSRAPAPPSGTAALSCLGVPLAVILSLAGGALRWRGQFG